MRGSQPHPGTATSLQGGNLEASDVSAGTMLDGSRVWEESLLSFQVLKREAEDVRRQYWWTVPIRLRTEKQNLHDKGTWCISDSSSKQGQTDRSTTQVWELETSDGLPPMPHADNSLFYHLTLLGHFCRCAESAVTVSLFSHSPSKTLIFLVLSSFLWVSARYLVIFWDLSNLATLYWVKRC